MDMNGCSVSIKTCRVCGKDRVWCAIALTGPEPVFIVCSVECLLEWAFKLKESQPKLSKPKLGVDVSGNPVEGP